MLTTQVLDASTVCSLSTTSMTPSRDKVEKLLLLAETVTGDEMLAEGMMTVAGVLEA